MWTIKFLHEVVIKECITTNERLFNQAKLASLYALDVVIDCSDSKMGNRFLNRVTPY